MPTQHTHNDLMTQEWSQLNKRPLHTYGTQSHFKGSWKCSVCGFDWEATIANRSSKGSGCPQCWLQSKRGNSNSQWTGYGQLGGQQWHNITRDATRKHLSVDLTIEEAWEVFLEQGRRCALTGKELIMFARVKNKNVGNATLDRIDSSKGYTRNNVQWIDKRVQYIKRNLSDTEFLSICREVAVHHVRKTELPPPPSFHEWVGKEL